MAKVRMEQLTALTLQTGTVFPPSPNQGQIFFLTTDQKYYVYNGSTWELYATDARLTTYVQAAGKNSQGSKYVSTAAPSGSGYVVGDMWYQY